MSDQAGHVRISAAVVLMAACLAAAPSVAMAPPRQCPVDSQTHRMLDLGGRVPSHAAWVNIHSAGDGFATWTLQLANRAERYVVQHCASGRVLTVWASAGDRYPVGEAFYEMVHGQAPYTFDQIAEATRALGARASLTRGSQGDCACLNLFGGA